MYNRGELWFHPQLIRQRKICRNLNFKCVYDVCLLSRDALSGSEERRHAMRHVEDMIASTMFTSPCQALGFCRKMLTLLAEEAEVMGRETAYYNAFKICVANSDLLRASAFITKFVAETKLLRGGDAGAVVEEERYIKNPQEHRLGNWTSVWKSTRKPNHGPETPEYEEWLWTRAL